MDGYEQSASPIREKIPQVTLDKRLSLSQFRPGRTGEEK